MTVFYLQTPVVKPNGRKLEIYIESPHETVDELVEDIRKHGVVAVDKVRRAETSDGVKRVVERERIGLGASYVGFIQDPRARGMKVESGQ
jgi:hypothetical protein